jgi:hypothetical protein
MQHTSRKRRNDGAKRVRTRLQSRSYLPLPRIKTYAETKVYKESAEGDLESRLAYV